MLTLLTTNNSVVLRQVGALTLQKLGIDHQVATNGPQALELIRQHKPALAVLDAELPEMSGFEVCRRIKGDPELRTMRVIIVLEGLIGRAQIEELASSNCDDVFSVPAPSGELYQHVARLCGLPTRISRRIGVEIRAELEAGPRTLRGRIVNLSREGARVEIDERLPDTTELRLRLFRSESERAAFMRARVVWEKPPRAGAAGSVLGLQFFDLATEVRTILDDLALWEVIEIDDGVQVLLQGDFTEITDFGPLAQHLTGGRVEFDLSAVRYMNSSGVRNWITFLRRLDHLDEYCFVRCSVGFVSQAGMVPAVLGKGGVVSLWAPYHCDRCDQSDERLLQVSMLLSRAEEGGDDKPTSFGSMVVYPSGTNMRVDVPRFACAQCQGELVFDDLPERYFAFLSRPS